MKPDDKDAALKDVKEIQVTLGVEDVDVEITLQVFSDKDFCIALNGEGVGMGQDGEIIVNDLPLDVARRLRDFLNYAIKD